MNSIIIKKTIIKKKRMAAGPHLDVTFETPIGPMKAGVTERGVSWLRFPETGERTLGGDPGVGQILIKACEWSEVGEAAPAGALEEANRLREYLADYFAGRAPRSLPAIDDAGYPEFDRAVWRATCAIGAGETATYGQIAAAIGRAGAARAVGGALGRNPIVLLIPCHRVVAAATGERRLCGFTGGLEMKRFLLEHETLAAK